jgi:hypothetical protein
MIKYYISCDESYGFYSDKTQALVGLMQLIIKLDIVPLMEMYEDQSTTVIPARKICVYKKNRGVGP